MSRAAVSFATSGTGYGLSSGGIAALALADFTEDGLVDVAMLESQNDVFTVYINKGRGVLIKQSSFITGDGPRAIDTLDLNNDGHRDVVVTNEYSDDLSAFAGDGKGGFLAVSAMSVDSSPQGLAIGIIDDDRLEDVVVANTGSDNITVLLSNGVGGFNTKNIFIGAGVCPANIAARQFNPRADSYLDIAITGACDNRLHVLLGDGRGGFSQSPDEPQKTT